MIRLHTVPELLVLPQALEVRNVAHDKLHNVVVVSEFLGHLHLFGVGEEGGEVVDLDERSVFILILILILILVGGDGRKGGDTYQVVLLDAVFQEEWQGERGMVLG